MTVVLRVEALVLDMDETINRTTRAMDAGLRAAILRLWPLLPEETLRTAVDAYVVDENGWFERFSRGVLDFSRMRRGRLADLVTRLGGTFDEERFQLFEQTYRRVFEDSCIAYRDALRLLDRADAAAIPVAVLSNSAERMTRMKVRRLGLAGRFVAVLSCDQLDAGKPDPRAYLAACRSLGREPAAVGYVDDLRRDALGAKRAGLQSVWLDRAAALPGSDAGPEALSSVSDLDDLRIEPLCVTGR